MLKHDTARRALSATTALTGFAAISLSMIATPAFAQAEESEEEILDVTTPQAAEEDGAIVVVGSRLRRTEFNSPDPIQIISPELGIKKGQADAADLLQNSPLAAGSTQITSTLSSNFVTDGGVGAQTLSLRGLGANRTLVLLNGRRAGPAGTRGAVSSFDLNVLPISIISDVEILKTGASSIYGSDAVAGVVNIKTRQDLDGFDVSLFASPTEDGGGESYQTSLAWGKVFDRGHIMFAGDYYRRNELERRDRDYLSCDEDYIVNEAGQRADITDPRTGQPYCNGTIGNLIFTYDYIGLVGNAFGIPTPSNLFTPGGQAIQIIQPDRGGDRLGEFLPALSPATQFFQFSAPSNYFPVNFDGPSTGLLNLYPEAEQKESVIPKTDRYTLYANGAYEITDNVELYGEALYNKRKTHVDASRQLFPTMYTGYSALPYFFGDSEALFSGDPLNDEFEGEVLLQPIIVTDKFDQDIEVDYYRGVLGARGDYGSMIPNWSWDIYGQFSRSDGSYTSDIIFNDAYETLNYRTQLCEGTVTSVRGVPCVDIDVTSPETLAGNFTPEEEAFLFGRDTGTTRYDQWSTEFFTSGDLFKLPGGMSQLGVGVQFRRDEITDTPGPATLAGNSWGLTSAGITAGKSDTYEAFGELELPIFGGVPFVEDFTINLAGRFTRVDAERSSDGASDSDEDFTYKIGANWQVTDWLRFRGSYGTSFRTPALYEQFLQDQTGFLDQLSVDPCIRWGTGLANGAVTQRLADNCAAAGVPADYNGVGSSAQTISGGGIGVLDSETSRAWSGSVILTPQLWSGSDFSLAVDYIDIKVKGEVTQLGAGNIVSSCYNSEFYPNDPLCDQFVRDSDPNSTSFNNILTIRNPYLNIDSQRNRAVDVTLQFSQDLGNMGELGLLAQMTWQLEDKFGLFDNTISDDNGEVGDPKWVGDFAVSWARKAVTVLWSMDVIGKTSDKEDVLDTYGTLCPRSGFRGGNVCPDYTLGTTFYHNASVNLEVASDFDLTLGVANIFDTAPPRASSVFSTISHIGQAPTIGTYYDYLGRRAFVRARARF